MNPETGSREPGIDRSLTGRPLEPLQWRWAAADTILYALGVGATVDLDLPFLYEGRGPLVLSSFASLATGRGFLPMVTELGLPLGAVLHAEEHLVVDECFPHAGDVTVERRVADVWDKGSGALLAVEEEVTDGRTLARLRSTWWVAGAGGFGGERGPGPPAWAKPLKRTPDQKVQFSIGADQAALYRLSGDLNPLHIDPAAAAAAGYSRPFLHGLCTFGMVALAISRTYCGDRPHRLRELTTRFTRPVSPGDELVVSIWNLEANQLSVRVTGSDSDTVCVGRATLIDD